MSSMDTPPRVVATFVGAARVELLCYPDGGMGIRRDGLMTGTWRKSEVQECLRAFFAMTGVPDEFVWRVHAHGAAPRRDALN